MSFASALKAYCDDLGCSNKAIAGACGVSASSLSRYLNGERAPEPGSPIIENLARGIESLALDEQASRHLSAEAIRASLESELTGSNMVGMDFHARLDALMSLVGMSNVSLAETAGVDPSYVSRIRRGQRKPADLSRFAFICAHLAALQCIESQMFDEMGELVGVPDLGTGHPEWDPYEESNVAEIIGEWLKGNQIVQADMAKLDDLLSWFDEKDFSQWLSVDNDSAGEAEHPTSPLARFYYGVGGMRAAELEFLKMAANTHCHDMSLSSDIPLMDIPPDSTFIERYGQAMINVLKTGCHVNVFHNIERPFEDTLRSMRIWMPIYLSGQVTPFYLEGVNNRLFYHMNYVCDTCALSSEAVVGHEEEGRYYLTTRPEDVSYYIRKMQLILGKASSLLEIYRECDPEQQLAFERTEAARRENGKPRLIGVGRFQNIEVAHYVGDCTVLSLPCEATVVHFVIRHPKINYLIAHME